MIARHFFLFILLILLPDLFLFIRYIWRRNLPVWVKALWWIITIVLLVYTSLLARCQDYTPQQPIWLNIYLFILGAFIVPKAVLALCASLGRGVSNRFHARHNWGLLPGVLLALLFVFITIYGSFWGFGKFEVHRMDYHSSRLPKGFDGYKIALFSDAHVGSYRGGDRHVLADAIDSINALHPDIIFFLGDLQNTRPEEIQEHKPVLSRLKAPDGVYSILGNHDYSHYIGGTREEKLAAEKKTQRLEREMGWRLLLNESTILHHGGDSIYLAGMKGNDGKGEDHDTPNYENTIKDIPKGVFSIMLLHNPRYWKPYVIEPSDIPLTLSGHTHGGQVNLFGMTTSSLVFDEYDGMYEVDGRHLYVSRGLGGLIPMRFNVTGEVVLLTLHCE
jgi:predicted MPP superfamily phosphohydrolase